MSYIDWSDKYSVGNSMVDDQHQALMEIIDSPKLARHQAIHRQLIDQVKKLRGELVAGVAGSEQQIRFFPKNWLTAHIVGIDTQYTPFLGVHVH